MWEIIYIENKTLCSTQQLYKNEKTKKLFIYVCIKVCICRYIVYVWLSGF